MRFLLNAEQFKERNITVASDISICFLTGSLGSVVLFLEDFLDIMSWAYLKNSQ